MKYVLSLLMVLLMACNSGTGDAGYTDDNLPDPAKVNPPSQTIPEDMKIRNDSVVVPDSAAIRRAMDSANQRRDSM